MAQVDVATAFFALPEAEGFVLVGGAALISLQFVDRFTEDLDFFTDDSTKVGAMADAFEKAALAAHWTVVSVRSSPTFHRFEVGIRDESVRVDIAVDSSPYLASVESFLGPTLAPVELGARKLLALFDRAQPRDFVDVYTLAESFGKQVVFELAAQIDAGLDRTYLVVAFAILNRIPAELLPCNPDTVEPTRAFFATWSQELSVNTNPQVT
jgi:predicted nucleotidyltransferase component of viral defense system